MKTSIAAFLLTLAIVEPALAQDYRSSNPALKHFYMSRLQVQIVDEAPIVNQQSGTPGAAGGGQGGLPQGTNFGLPKSGFTQYSQQLPQFQTSLPKVVNGVPPKMPPQKGLSANAGKLGSKKAVARPVARQAPTMATYKSTYDGASTTYAGGGYSGGSYSSSSSVRGSVLHWARKRRGY